MNSKKEIFVIMPFSQTPTRNQEDLTTFFENNLKTRIENEEIFKQQYVVKRSDDRFNITEQTIKDLYRADIVLCDLSGQHPNPNVMYELGIRLSVSHKPVILFREANSDNQQVFDIRGYYIYEYNPFQYKDLEDHIVNKIIQYNSEIVSFSSPIMNVLKTEPLVIRELNRRRASNLLKSLELGLSALNRSLGIAIYEHLTINEKLKFADGKDPRYIDADYIIDAFHNNKAVKGANWENFSYRPNSYPSFNAFLSEYPLEDLVDPIVEKAFNTVLHEYYTAFLISDANWMIPNRGLLIIFLMETRMLGYASNFLNILINETPEKGSEVGLEGFKVAFMTTQLIEEKSKKKFAENFPGIYRG